MYFVYVLANRDKNWFYKGLTNNLEKRIKQHLNSQSQTTRKMLPLELVFVQICENRNEARSLEKLLKSGFGREIINEIVN